MILTPTYKGLTFRPIPRCYSNYDQFKYDKVITEIDDKKSFCVLSRKEEKTEFNYDTPPKHLYECKIKNIKDTLFTINHIELSLSSESKDNNSNNDSNNGFNEETFYSIQLDVYKNGEYLDTLRKDGNKFYFEFFYPKNFKFPSTYLNYNQLSLKIYSRKEISGLGVYVFLDSASEEEKKFLDMPRDVISRQGRYIFSNGCFDHIRNIGYSSMSKNLYFLINKEDENLKPIFIHSKYATQEIDNTN
jgi:hypothetical protein